jgi:hemerythrin-like domain-containing protein
MQGSMKAFARDVEQWVLNGLESVNSFVTEQGDLEDWNNNDTKYKEQVNNNLQEYLKHLKSHIDS